MTEDDNVMKNDMRIQEYLERMNLTKLIPKFLKQKVYFTVDLRYYVSDVNGTCEKIKPQFDLKKDSQIQRIARMMNNDTDAKEDFEFLS